MIMEQVDKTRKIFLVGTIILGLLIVGGLVWAVAMGPGGGNGGADQNIVFNDEGNPARGPDNAKVTVRIYSDFQCPACKIAEKTFQQIIKEYENRVRFVWNDMPLTSFHANALGAAVAGRCAQEQNKFWEYSSKLFETQSDWDKLTAPNDFFAGLAEQLGLQKDSFASCLGQVTPRSKVTKDEQEGIAIGVEATPTFFVNRFKYEGAADLAKWRQALDSQLK
jgi:protein-disulfide isomerase